MKLYDAKLLTVTCEILAQDKVKGILKRNGATGFTSYEVQGMGSRGMRGQGLPEEKNVKIEAVLQARALEGVVEEMLRTLMPDYAIMFYASDVQVARPEKFS